MGGLDAVVFKRLPIRQWDTWLNAKMPHPFFVKLEADATSPLGYRTVRVRFRVRARVRVRLRLRLRLRVRVSH